MLCRTTVNEGDRGTIDLVGPSSQSSHCRRGSLQLQSAPAPYKARLSFCANKPRPALTFRLCVFTFLQLIFQYLCRVLAESFVFLRVTSSSSLPCPSLSSSFTSEVSSLYLNSCQSERAQTERRRRKRAGMDIRQHYRLGSG